MEVTQRKQNEIHLSQINVVQKKENKLILMKVTQGKIKFS